MNHARRLAIILLFTALPLGDGPDPAGLLRYGCKVEQIENKPLFLVRAWGEHDGKGRDWHKLLAVRKSASEGARDCAKFMEREERAIARAKRAGAR